MQSRGWLILGILVFPALASAQAVKEADMVGGWKGEIERAGADGVEENVGPTGLILWPDGLWAFRGAFVSDQHGGARWRLIGDTLWLGNDHVPYWHQMSQTRLSAIGKKGQNPAAMDMDVIAQRPPYPVPDSVYWSKAFRDTTTACGPPCGTYVYKVSVKDRQDSAVRQVSLVRLDSLSTAAQGAATTAVLTRDSLVDCGSYCP